LRYYCCDARKPRRHHQHVAAAERCAPEHRPRAVHTFQLLGAAHGGGEIRQVSLRIDQSARPALAVPKSPVIDQQDRQAGGAQAFGEGR
jgi:hypothetical protein